jgi:protein-disulfide isomerase
MRATLCVLAALAAGCGGGATQPTFPELAPVKGVVKRGGQPVKGGTVQFLPDPDRPDFLTNSEVGADGTFALTTVRTTDRTGERKAGAPVGKYKAVYQPPLGDQTAGGQLDPITIPGPFEVKAGGSEIMVELPKK